MRWAQLKVERLDIGASSQISNEAAMMSCERDGCFLMVGLSELLRDSIGITRSLKGNKYSGESNYYRI